MKVGDVVQIHMPEYMKVVDFYRFNNCVGEIVEVVECRNETGFAVVAGTDGGLWDFEWLTPFERPEEEETIETTDLKELWRLK